MNENNIIEAVPAKKEEFKYFWQKSGDKSWQELCEIYNKRIKEVEAKILNHEKDIKELKEEKEALLAEQMKVIANIKK